MLSVWAIHSVGHPHCLQVCELFTHAWSTPLASRSFTLCLCNNNAHWHMHSSAWIKYTHLLRLVQWEVVGWARLSQGWMSEWNEVNKTGDVRAQLPWYLYMYGRLTKQPADYLSVVYATLCMGTVSYWEYESVLTEINLRLTHTLTQCQAQWLMRVFCYRLKIRS